MEEIQKMCAIKSNFEDVYSGLNEKYINEIIDQESEKQKKPCCPTCGRNEPSNSIAGSDQVSSFLLIGENEIKKKNDHVKTNSMKDQNTSPMVFKNKVKEERALSTERQMRNYAKPLNRSVNTTTVLD